MASVWAKARLRAPSLTSGAGTMTGKGKPLNEYFPRIFSQQLAKSSLVVAGEQTFDIKAFCNPRHQRPRPELSSTASPSVWSL